MINEIVSIILSAVFPGSSKSSSNDNVGRTNDREKSEKAARWDTAYKNAEKTSYEDLCKVDAQWHASGGAGEPDKKYL
ncbi:hypothetical protein [Gluconobacter oxydans]|uniref:hypothetical protein n=1 Tax=Gluconobacter oxydans TaxID=442 RepID=UPI000A5FF4BD|nr:hypothetical protein [Gluconobacter oxydans]